ncbi:MULTISPECIES: helix-turn-helix domain-containing protein, partial [Vibrio]
KFATEPFLLLNPSEGRHLGRFPNKTLHTRTQELADRGMNKHAISKELECSRTTVYKVLGKNISL